MLKIFLYIFYLVLVFFGVYILKDFPFDNLGKFGLWLDKNFDRVLDFSALTVFTRLLVAREKEKATNKEIYKAFVQEKKSIQVEFKEAWIRLLNVEKNGEYLETALTFLYAQMYLIMLILAKKIDK